MKQHEFMRVSENWESALDMQLLLSQADPARHKGYICSPCRSDTETGILANMKAARYYMYYAYKAMGYSPCAPHAYLPAILSDQIPHQRALALKFGRELLETANEVLVCGHILSDGMCGEIEKAAAEGIPITVFNCKLYLKIMDAVGSKACRFDGRHPSLALNAGELFEGGLIDVMQF